MTALIPRVVVVTRETEYQMLLARHATRGQVEFFLRNRGQSIEQVDQRHQQHQATIHTVMAAIPKDWRRNLVMRNELDRFLFEPEDLIIAVGQDGLVANTAKYLKGQSVIGVNPDTELYDGILVPFSSQQSIDLIQPAMHKEVSIQYRTMAQVRLDDGQHLVALNELFIGHHSHQSARYTICATNHKEHQSSSGVIVSTGTGATGWARSIHRERHDKISLPTPEDDLLAFYVREAFPSISSGTNVTSGLINKNQTLIIISEINEGGVIFGDGIEADYLPFNWGSNASFTVADNKLALVRP
jgi:NAD kinase